MGNRRNFIKASSLLIASAGAFGYKVAYSGSNSFSTNTKSKKAMLQHNVYFYLKNDVSKKQRDDFTKGINKFLSAVKEVKKYEIGIPAGTPDRDVVDHNFGVSLFSWFSSIEEHNVYQEHSAHTKFIEDWSNLWEEVKVFDSELI